MTNEAVLMVETELPISMTVDNTVGIEKGDILQMTDPLTASAQGGNNQIVAGIACGEKIANDGNTKLGVYRRGIFKVVASGTIALGDPVGTTAFVNEVASNRATTRLSGSRVLGYSLEAATDGESFLMELNPSGPTYILG